jgi:phage head maturation protease
MERKTFKATATKIADAAQGIVTAFFAVFGNVDLGNDRIHPGAFSKTFSERGLSVKVLDQHRTDTGMAAIGRPLELREVSQAELPPSLVAEYPDATGAAEATVQFLMDTPEGKGIFTRLAQGALDQWSFAYDPLDFDFSTEMVNGEEKTVRNLRTLRLFELSPVLFGMNPGMNPATATTSVKADDDQEPEAKPWATFPINDEFCVYRIDEQGERMGDSLGCHATDEAAQAQIRALYASENAGKAAKAENLSEHVERVRSAIDAQFNPPNGPWDWWAREVFDEFVQVSHSGQQGPEYFQIPYTMDEEGAVTFAPRSEWVSGSFEFVADNAPPEMAAAETDQGQKKAGPVQPPTSEVTLGEVEVWMAEIEMELLEVE